MINRLLHSTEQVIKYFFPPHAGRSHEADAEEQKPSRNQIRFKGTDFQIKKHHTKKNQKYFPNSQTLIFRVKYGFQNKYKAHI